MRYWATNESHKKPKTISIKIPFRRIVRKPTTLRQAQGPVGYKPLCSSKVLLIEDRSLSLSKRHRRCQERRSDGRAMCRACRCIARRASTPLSNRRAYRDQAPCPENIKYLIPHEILTCFHLSTVRRSLCQCQHNRGTHNGSAKTGKDFAGGSGRPVDP